MPADWCRFDAAGRVLTLVVHVQPNARTSAIAGVHGDALKIRVAAPAVDNKANAALLDYLARVLEVSAGRLALKRGTRGRRKAVEVRDATPELITRIESMLTG